MTINLLKSNIFKLIRAGRFILCSFISVTCYGQTVQTITVSTLSDANPAPANSLRKAIETINACTTGCADLYIIKFSVSGQINLVEGLDCITKKVKIDGSTAPGYNFYTKTPVITFYAAALINGGICFSSNSNYSSSGSILNGVAIQRFNVGAILHANNIEVSNCVFSNFPDVSYIIGIHINESANHRINNNTIILSQYYNSLSGVNGIQYSTAASVNTIGSKIEKNTIYNVENGIYLNGGTQRNKITKNRIYNFSYKAIDWQQSNVNSNESPNEGKSHPVGSYSSDGVNLSVSGSAEPFDIIELFTSASYGSYSNATDVECYFYIASIQADGDGDWNTSIPLNLLPSDINPNPFYGMTATATDSKGNTSQVNALQAVNDEEIDGLRVCGPPKVTTSPQCAGVILCAPSGFDSYQWEKDEAIISGSSAQQNCYTIPTGEENHQYRVKVTNTSSGCTGSFYSENITVY